MTFYMTLFYFETETMLRSKNCTAINHIYKRIISASYNDCLIINPLFRNKAVSYKMAVLNQWSDAAIKSSEHILLEYRTVTREVQDPSHRRS